MKKTQLKEKVEIYVQASVYDRFRDARRYPREISRAKAVKIMDEIEALIIERLGELKK